MSNLKIPHAWTAKCIADKHMCAIDQMLPLTDSNISRPSQPRLDCAAIVKNRTAEIISIDGKPIHMQVYISGSST